MYKSTSIPTKRTPCIDQPPESSVTPEEFRALIYQLPRNYDHFIELLSEPDCCAQARWYLIPLMNKLQSADFMLYLFRNKTEPINEAELESIEALIANSDGKTKGTIFKSLKLYIKNTEYIYRIPMIVITYIDGTLIDGISLLNYCLKNHAFSHELCYSLLNKITPELLESNTKQCYKLVYNLVDGNLSSMYKYLIPSLLKSLKESPYSIREIAIMILVELFTTDESGLAFISDHFVELLDDCETSLIHDLIFVIYTSLESGYELKADPTPIYNLCDSEDLLVSRKANKMVKLLNASSF